MVGMAASRSMGTLRGKGKAKWLGEAKGKRQQTQWAYMARMAASRPMDTLKGKSKAKWARKAQGKR